MADKKNFSETGLPFLQSGINHFVSGTKVKKIVFIGMVMLGLASCDNVGRVEIRTDSLKKGLEVNLDKLGDSAKAKGERTLEVIKEKVNDLGKKSDSVRKDSIQ